MESLQSFFTQDVKGATRELKVRAEYAGIGETVGSFWKTLDQLTLTEIEHRRCLLARKLKKPKMEEKYTKQEKEYHDKSVAQIEKTLFHTILRGG
ncbi:MAG: hypothetical protein ACFFDP_12705 [Promethearchaeota archaeon]